MKHTNRIFSRFLRSGSALVGWSCLTLSPAFAQTDRPPAVPSNANTIVLEPIIVRARETVPATSTIGQLPAPYAGGQVATAARLGMMGNRDVFRTPFSLTGYGGDLIADQQARSLGDVVLNQPSVRQDAPTFSERDAYFIRGFSVTNLDTLYDGLPYIVNPRRTLLDGIENVEILLGPTALAYGGTGRVGGTINLVPKRAGDDPLNRLTTSYLSDAQLWTQLDVGRRFGGAREWGVRGNASYRGGDTALDGNEVEVGNATLGLDYRGERLRASLDVVQSKQDIDAPTSLFNAAAPDIDIPPAPDGDVNTANPFEYNDSTYRMIAGRVEYDLQPNITIYGAIGASRYREDFLTSNYLITSANGDATNIFGYNPQEIEGLSGEVGLRSEFRTGEVGHRLNISAARSINNNNRGEFNPRTLGFPEQDTNIYDPTYLPDGSVDLTGLPRSHELIRFADLRTSSIAISDTLSLLDDRLELTLGGRYQEIVSRGFNTRPGNPTAPVGEQNYDNKDSETTPALAASVRVTDALSLYANYVESLTEGPTAPLTAVNSGEIFPSVINRQKEIGAKYDFGRVAVTAALFEIRQPSGLTDPATNTFDVNGEQINRGLELSVFGQPADGVQLLGGVTFMDAELNRTQDGEFDGNRATGVPRTAVSFYGEVDTPWIAPDLTLTGRVVHNGSTYYDRAGTQKIEDWTRIDLGARYLVERPGGKDIELRANIENVLDENYWASSARGFLSTGAPRTVVLSASMSF